MPESDLLGTAVIEIRASFEKLTKDLDKAKKLSQGLPDASVKVSPAVDRAKADLANVAKQVDRLPNGDVKVAAETAAAKRNMEAVEAQVRRIDALSPDVKVDADTRGALTEMSRVSRASGDLTGSLGSLRNAAVGVGVAMAAQRLLANAFEDIKRTAAATAQLDQGLRTTGNAANTTAAGLAGYADALESVTGMQAETILEGQGVLLTFTNIRNEAGLGNDIFNQATEASLNLAAKGFGSIESSSVMLGKALNDPIKGITAMGKAGITFSQDQKSMIASLVQSGDLLGAQKIILGELETQVGGAARAYGETMPGKIDRANAAIGNITETLLASASPALEAAASSVLTLSVNLGLLDSVDINLPEKLLELGSASLSASADWEVLRKSLRDTDIWEFGFSVGEGTKKVAEFDYAFAQLVSTGNVDRARELFKQAKAEILAAGGTMDDVHAKFPQYIAAEASYTASIQLTGDAQRDAATQTTAWGGELAELDTTVTDLTTSFDYLLGRFLTAEEAAIRSRESTRALTEAVREGQREDETAAAFKDRLSSSLIGTVNGLNNEYDALVRSGEATGTMADRNRFLNDKLNILAGTVPSLASQIAGYRDRLNEVPDDATTRFSTPGLNEGLTSARNFKGELNAIPNDIFVTIHPTLGPIDLRPLQNLNLLGREHGGPVEAGMPYVVGERRPELFVPDVAGTILPRVPMLADGGSITRSGYAMVGERGPEVRWLNRGETISPITNGPSRGGAVIFEAGAVVVEGNAIGMRDLASELEEIFSERGRGWRGRG